MPPLWQGLTDVTGYPVEEARAGVRQTMAARIAELAALVKHFDAAEQTLRETAPDRAMVPADTGQNRLLIRDIKSTESSFDRTLKTLAKLQSERQKAVQMEAKQASRGAANVGLPNEPELVGEKPTSHMYVGGCSKINK